MVFGRIASVLEKQKGTASVMFTFYCARQASIRLPEPSSEEETPSPHETLAVIRHMTLKNNNSGVNLHQIIGF